MGQTSSPESAMLDIPNLAHQPRELLLSAQSVSSKVSIDHQSPMTTASKFQVHESEVLGVHGTLKAEAKTAEGQDDIVLEGTTRYVNVCSVM